MQDDGAPVHFDDAEVARAALDELELVEAEQAS
jgi:hypothetical protein